MKIFDCAFTVENPDGGCINGRYARGKIHLTGLEYPNKNTPWLGSASLSAKQAEKCFEILRAAIADEKELFGGGLK